MNDRAAILYHICSLFGQSFVVFACLFVAGYQTFIVWPDIRDAANVIKAQNELIEKQAKEDTVLRNQWSKEDAAMRDRDVLERVDALTKTIQIKRNMKDIEDAQDRILRRAAEETIFNP